MKVKLIKHTVKRDKFGAPYNLSPALCCKACGSNNVVLIAVPGRVMGATWIPGTDMSGCNYCGKNTING